MGSLVSKPSAQKRFDIELKWNPKLGELELHGSGNAAEIVEVIDFDHTATEAEPEKTTEYSVDIKDGVGLLQFEKSDPAILYGVRLKSPPKDKKDQRLGFYY